MRSPLAVVGVLAACVAALLVSACAAPQMKREPESPPRRRLTGPRSIPFAGGDPAAKGWTRVDALLWVRSEDADAYRRGLLRCGERMVPIEEADRIEKTPEDGYVLRTDHLTLRTDVGFRRAVDLARIAETHVERLLAVFGGPLDLRTPDDPMRLVVAAHRLDFERILADRVAEPRAWGAFYAAADGAVYACDEPLATGGLSVVADLRHETTHAVLDLGRRDDGRHRMFSRPQFWVWEGVAMWSEGLGDPPGAREGAERLARFRRRLAWGDVTPLSELFVLGQDGFLGRHYDEAASLMNWLMDADQGARRDGLFRLLARAMDGDAERDDFKAMVGLSPEDAERRWKASLSM
jgi:hypothetical protein